MKNKILLICLEGKKPVTEESFFKPILDGKNIYMLSLDPCSSKNYNEELWRKLLLDVFARFEINVSKQNDINLDVFVFHDDDDDDQSKPLDFSFNKLNQIINSIISNAYNIERLFDVGKSFDYFISLFFNLENYNKCQEYIVSKQLAKQIANKYSIKKGKYLSSMYDMIPNFNSKLKGYYKWVDCMNYVLNNYDISNKSKFFRIVRRILEVID